MSKDLLDRATSAMETAKKAGADECSVYIGKERFVEVSYRQRKPENITEASKLSLNVAIYVNNRFSSQGTSDLRPKSLESFISNAVETTRLLAEDPYRSLPDLKYCEGRPDIDLKINDPSQSTLTPERRHAMVQATENACLDKGGEKTISVTAYEHDSYNEWVKVRSNGFKGGAKSTSFWLGAEMTAQGEGDRRPSEWNFVSSRMLSDLSDSEAIGAEAAKRTLARLGAKKIKTEKLPIIVENKKVSRLLGGFLSALSARNIQQKRSFLAEKKGRKIGSDLFTIIDNPLIISGLGSRLFDGDGFASKKRSFVENGTLKEFLVDWYYSRKLGWEPTGGGTSNVIIPPGERNVSQIMKELKRGIYITNFLGGNSNSTTGDFSVGIEGQLFEDGIPVQAVDEMNIADNHLEFWNKLIETANDPYLFSSRRLPSLVFKDIVVSGI